MGTRHRLGRPTALARNLRNDPTDAEKLLWKHLRQSQWAGFKFSRQLPIAGFVCDFVCRSARLIVEADGSQHDWQADADVSRTRVLEAAGYHVVRFWNNDILSNIEGVLIEIERALRARAHPPTPSRKREGERYLNPPFPLAGGDRGVGTRSRPEQTSRERE